MNWGFEVWAQIITALIFIIVKHQDIMLLFSLWTVCVCVLYAVIVTHFESWKLLQPETTHTYMYTHRALLSLKALSWGYRATWCSLLKDRVNERERAKESFKKGSVKEELCSFEQRINRGIDFLSFFLSFFCSHQSPWKIWCTMLPPTVKEGTLSFCSVFFCYLIQFQSNELLQTNSAQWNT